MKLITFSGLDGSGKSTQIKFFTKNLQSQNQRVKTIHIIKNSIANRFNEKGKQPGRTKPVTSSGLVGILLRKITLLFDILLFRISILFNSKNCDVLICDRYFYDYLINIYYLEREFSPSLSPILKCLIPKPDLAIYLKVNPRLAFKRRDEQGLSYLRKKYRLFENLRKEFDFQIVTPEKEKQVATQKILGLWENIK